MAVRIQFRRGTAAEWAAANPTLGAGEAGYETDTAKFKLGTGNTVWNSLAYAGVNQSDIEDAVSAVIDSAPNALNTLNELAAALNDDASFANTIINNISNVGANATTYTNDQIVLHNGSINVHGITNTANLVYNSTLATYSTIINVDNVVATHNSDTTNVHGIANTALLATNSDVDLAISNHNLDTTNVHGIANTALLVTQAGLSNVANDVANVNSTLATHTSAGINVHGIANTANLVTTTALSSAVSDHNALTTSVHGISDTANLVYQSQLNAKAALAGPTFTGNVVLPSTTSIGDVSATEISYLNNVSSAIQTQLDAKAALAGPTFTGNVVLPSTTSIGDVSSIEIGYLNNVSSAIQTQLDAKLAITSANSIYAKLDGATFTGNVVLTANTTIGTVDSTELGYLNGITSSVQNQLDAKAPTANPTFTGTVAGVTKSHVGLGNVDNTADADKPISNATQTALDAKLSLSGGTMTGRVTLSADPTQALHAVTKQYVDGIESGLKAKPAVLAATSTNVAGTYNNGTSGVGATLTAASNGSINTAAPSGVSTWVVGSGILLKNQTNKAHNGRYVVTNLGSVSTPYVLTRCGLCDEASEIPGAYVFVQDGAHEGTGWVQIVADPATFVVGTDDIDVFQFSGAGTITAGTNISVSGNQVSVVTNPTFANVVTASSGVAFSDGTQTKVGVPSITTIDAKTASYTLSALTERDSIIEISNASATTLTIPLNSSVAYPVGTTIDIIQTGAGQVTIGNAVGVTVNATPGLKLRTQWSSATLLKRATNTWLVYGDLTA